jgi:hypothetical protein
MILNHLHEVYMSDGREFLDRQLKNGLKKVGRGNSTGLI